MHCTVCSYQHIQVIKQKVKFPLQLTFKPLQLALALIFSSVLSHTIRSYCYMFFMIRFKITFEVCCIIFSLRMGKFTKFSYCYPSYDPVDSLNFDGNKLIFWPNNYRQISTNNSLVKFLEIYSAATAYMHSLWLMCYNSVWIATL